MPTLKNNTSNLRKKPAVNTVHSAGWEDVARNLSKPSAEMMRSVRVIPQEQRTSSLKPTISQPWTQGPEQMWLCSPRDAVPVLVHSPGLSAARSTCSSLLRKLYEKILQSESDEEAGWPGILFRSIWRCDRASYNNRIGGQVPTKWVRALTFPCALEISSSTTKLSHG